MVDVYEWQQQQLSQGHRVDRLLSQRHVVVENYEKMNLKTAVDVVSEPIASTMEALVSDSEG